jgi:hypothetical protein
MTDETMFTAKVADGFTTESPIRAFTDFKATGTYAIGKGFRPSLAHLGSYLHALEVRERWQMVQILMPDNEAGDPTIIFHKVMPPMVAYHIPRMDRGFVPTKDLQREHRATMSQVFGEPYTGNDDLFVEHAADWFKVDLDTLKEQYNRNREGLKTARGDLLARCPCIFPATPPEIERCVEAYDPYKGVADFIRANGSEFKKALLDDAPIARGTVSFAKVSGQEPDDPIHPKHYDGVACCEIIDHMPFNVGVAGKYIWRLGEKDEIAQEIGKLIFYLKRQIDIEVNRKCDDHPFGAVYGFSDPKGAQWFKDLAKVRINARFGDNDLDVSRATAMTALVYYTTSGSVRFLENAIAEMEAIL